MTNIIDLDYRASDSLRLTLAYSGGTVVIGYVEREETRLIVSLTEAQAINLMLELREALKDLNTEDTGTD